MPRKEINDFYRKLDKEIVFDPITGICPAGEVELSAILAYHHQQKLIDWRKAKIAMYSPTKSTYPYDPYLTLLKVLREKGRTMTEYPLFAKDKKQISRWGDMKGDIIFISNLTKSIVLFESKVDSNFTHGNYPPNGQLSLILEYLSALPSRFEKRFMILIFPEINREWYTSRLDAAFKFKDYYKKNIMVGFTSWEEVHSAYVHNKS